MDTRGATRYTHVAYLPDVVHGNVAGFYAVVTDVTARVETDRARSESLRMFEVMVANAPFGKAILDSAGRVLHINPALCEVLGCASEEVGGCRLSAVRPCRRCRGLGRRDRDRLRRSGRVQADQRHSRTRRG